MLEKELIIELMKFTQFVTAYLVPLHEQETIGKVGKDFFCTDWWTIEVAKCLFNGKETYLQDPPPWRLRENKNFNKDSIIKDAEIRISMFEKLKEIQDSAEQILFCKVGRGIDIILANYMKPWKRILCYDDNPHYGNFFNIYFKDKLNLNIEFTQTDTDGFKFDSINENTILIGNQGMKKCGFGKAYHTTLPNKYFVKKIINGEFKDGL